MTKPKFKKGQEVVIRRNLGVDNSRYKGRYYHGASVFSVPLGTKATITRIISDDNIELRPAYGNIMNVHPGELYSKEDLKEIEREETEEMGSFLERSLRETQTLKEKTEREVPETPVVETETTANVKKRRTSFFERLAYGIKSFFGDVPQQKAKDYSIPESVKRDKIDYLLDEEVVESGNGRHKFDPKFNPREEFAVWMRQEFPDLDKYRSNTGKYRELEDRRKEVHKAAIRACKHGIETTDSCVKSQFATTLNELEANTSYYYSLYGLVDFIERLSANLVDDRQRHYGTTIKTKK